jgi:hypothetical protein
MMRRLLVRILFFPLVQTCKKKKKSISHFIITISLIKCFSFLKKKSAININRLKETAASLATQGCWTTFRFMVTVVPRDPHAQRLNPIIVRIFDKDL